MRGKFFLIFFLGFFFVKNIAFAITVGCERTSNSSMGFTDFKAFESWWPKNIYLEGSLFKDAGSGSKAMVYKRDEHIFRLLPNGKLIGSIKNYGNYAQVDNIRYKCDINSNELRKRITQNTSSGIESSNEVKAVPSSSSTKIDKAKSTCTDLGFTAGTEKHGECVLKLMDK